MLRLIGRRLGPVLRVERRHMTLYQPVERRRAASFGRADGRRTRIAA